MINDADLANKAIIAFKNGNREQTTTILLDLIKRKPNIGQHWENLARVATTIGEGTIATESAKLYSKLAPNDPQIQLSCAGIMAENGKIKDAITFIKPLTLKNPKEAALHHFMGTALSQVGDNKSAIKSLQHALKIWETSGHTWLTLASIKKFTLKDKDFLKLQQLSSAMSNLPPQTYVPYLYALGKAFNDTGQYTESFSAFQKGAKLMKQNTNYNFHDNQKNINTIISGFNINGLNSLTPSGIDNNRPIFVMGWPRTGTTLVEQILASHRAVAGGAELNLFGMAISALKGATLNHALTYEKNFTGRANPWEDMAHQYLHLLSERFGPEGRIIDKSLNNGRFVGLIQHIFPDAPIIWLQRNPTDAAWSCFKTFFNKSLDWSWSFTDIAHHFNLEDALLEHWSKLFPKKILKVPYEELVKDPNIWIPRILDHCHLEEDKNVYRFYKTKRAILTASVEQVRRPLTQNSIDASNNYKQYMADFINNYKF